MSEVKFTIELLQGRTDSNLDMTGALSLILEQSFIYVAIEINENFYLMQISGL